MLLLPFVLIQGRLPLVLLEHVDGLGAPVVLRLLVVDVRVLPPVLLFQSLLHEPLCLGHSVLNFLDSDAVKSSRILIVHRCFSDDFQVFEAVMSVLARCRRSLCALLLRKVEDDVDLRGLVLLVDCILSRDVAAEMVDLSAQELLALGFFGGVP